MEVLAACHVHSVWSYDGSWTLPALSDKFRRRGCRILMVTEHDRGFTAARQEEHRVACAEASSDEILVVPGMEYSDANNRVHTLVWGPVPFLGENLPTLDVLKAVKAASGIAVFAHPSRREAWKCLTPEWSEHLLGIELWNRKYDGWTLSKTAPGLLRASGAVPFVGLDFHTEKQSFPLGMALEMEGEITEANILQSLRARRCSARAFGMSLNQSLLRGSMRILNVAEQGRRTAARTARRLGLKR